MEFRVLGPVEVHDGGQRLNIGPARQRAVLAVLLLDLGQVVMAERLVGRVWGNDPPPSARNALHGHVMRLRAAIGSGSGSGTQLVRRAGGYVLEAGPEQVDVCEFRRLVAAAAASGADDRGAELLRGALGSWRGTALAGVASSWLDAMRDALELERRTAALDLNDIGLRQGRHESLAGELTELAEASPGDQRLVGQLMLALYRSGRIADALWRFERTRRRLADELGADPEPRLQELHHQILRGDRSLDWPGPAGQGEGLGGSGSGRPVPRELPADVPAFTGRAEELAELDRLLAGHADDGEPRDGEPNTVVVSAVAGTAGVGKTALAVRWAHQAADRFPDGQLYVDLRGYDPSQPLNAAEALAGLLSSLGVTSQGIPAELAQRAALYRSLLAGRRMLVVLDNAGDVEQVRPLLPGAAGCRVVVTSRDALAGLVARDGARRLDLDLLPMADAVALLRAVIGVRVDAEPEAAQTLAAHCARLPLALRVAAELAVAQPALPLARLAGELADEQGRLELLQAGGDPRTAVRAVFSWSCSHLEPSVVQGFALLGLHPGPDLEPYAAAAIADVTLPEARRLLAVLAAAHLIGPTPAGPDRYAMHDLLRAYARDLAATAGDQHRREALTRLLDCYVHTASAAMDTLYPAERHLRPALPTPDTPLPSVADADGARGWLDREMACLAAATGHAAADAWPGHATSLASTLYRDLISRGRSLLGVTIHNHAVNAARRMGDRAAEATALVNLGGSALQLGRSQEATGYLLRSLSLARDAGDVTAQTRALGNIGNAYMLQARFQEAAGYFAQTLALDRESGNLLGQTRTLTGLGNLNMMCSRYREGIGYLHQALAVARAIGDQLGEAVALSMLGYCETALGSHHQANRHLSRSLALSRRLGYRTQEAYALGGLGTVQSARGGHRQAIGLLQHAVAVYREFGSWSGEGKMLNHLGSAYFDDGQPAQARSQHAKALVVAGQAGDQNEQARALNGLAMCCQAAGDQDQARYHWQQALVIFNRIGSDEADQVRARLAATGPADVPALDRPG